jgi:hypothetical protein
MKFWEVYFDVATFFLIFSSWSKISPMTYVVRVISFSSLSCIVCFILPCEAANSPMTLISSSCNETKHCWRILCWSLIFSISLYDFLCANMVVMHSVGGNILMFSKAFCFFSCALINLSSKTFISRSSIRFVQICALSSHSFAHSSSSLLIFSTAVIVVLFLYSLSYGGVPDMVCNSKYSILVQKPLMTSLMFNTCSSSVYYTTIGISGISLKIFWMACCILSSCYSTSSFSFNIISAFSSTSLLSFNIISTFSSATLFFYKDVVFSS